MIHKILNLFKVKKIDLLVTAIELPPGVKLSLKSWQVKIGKENS